MNIDDLPAGPELDALVAEKVMGWTKWDWMQGDYNGPNDVTMFAYSESNPNERIQIYELGSDDPLRYFEPSTDIAAAWEVVEKLVDILPQGFTIHAYGFDQRWIAEWKFDHMGVLDDGYCQGDTAPLAICRAALKAVAKDDVARAPVGFVSE